MSRMRPWVQALVATLATGAGVAGGLACGAAARGTGRSHLPRAGSADDDGTGIVAGWSRGDLKARGVGPGRGYGGDRYGYGGHDYGGYDGYGGHGYGGADYGYGGDVYGYGGDLYGGYDGYGGYGGYIYGYGNVYGPRRPLPKVGGRYVISNVATGGTIAGVVTWRGAPAAAARVGKPGDACGAVANPTLRINGAGQVAHTLVYLVDIHTGKAPQVQGGVVEERGCAFAPHIQVAAPIDRPLVVANGEGEAHPIRAQLLGGADGKATQVGFDLTFKPWQEAELILGSPGIYELSSGPATAPRPASGWIVVAEHPYYAITDDSGRYRFDDVPPGEYTIVAWHEPVVTGTDGTGAPKRTAPVEVRARVRAVVGKTVTHDISLK